MEPTNFNQEGCDPMSSNCVIWQGPDIECINLCKGDSISTVVYQLGTQLCTLMDTFNIDNFDLTCLNVGACGPENFVELINLLIQNICTDNGIDPPEPGTAGCPDCEVEICSEFYYNDPHGNEIHTMNLDDYVIAIGNKICGIVGTINTINQTLINHEDRIEILENMEFPQPTLPTFTPACVINGSDVPLEEFLIAVEQAYCELVTATGGPQDILDAIASTCTGINTSPQLSGSGVMQDIQGWYATPGSLSESVSNIWLAICDMRAAILNIQTNCCAGSQGCDAIALTASLTLDGTNLDIDFGGALPNNFVDTAIGSTIVITATGGGSQTINNVFIKTLYFDPNNTLSIPLSGIDTNQSITVTITSRFEDTTAGLNCEKIIIAQLLVNSCPVIGISTTSTSAAYDFVWGGVVPITVEVQLFKSGTQVQSQNVNITSSTLNVTGTFTGLTAGTNYEIRIVVNSVPCPFTNFSTPTEACNAPTILAPIIDYTNPEGSGDCQTI